MVRVSWSDFPAGISREAFRSPGGRTRLGRCWGRLALLGLMVLPACQPAPPPPARSSVVRKTPPASPANNAAPVSAAARSKSSVAQAETRTEPARPLVAGETLAQEPAGLSPPQPVFRLSSPPRPWDDARLARSGVLRYESRRLRLYTDIAPEAARKLPPYMEAVYPEWEKYFGPLPPNRERTEFQITGYVMTDREKFRELGLIPADLPPFIQGRHRGAEFWMLDQATEYYRAHLLLHEGTHSYMAFIPGVPLDAYWYIEGIAELFGTHARLPDGTLQFRLFPPHKAGFANWGRTEIMREEWVAGRGKSVGDVLQFAPRDFLNNASYGWSWGLCQFLEQHPRYRERFRKLTGTLRPGQALADFDHLYAADRHELEDEWLLFAEHVCYGYDIERAVIDFKKGLPLGETAMKLTVAANRGWQSSSVWVERGGNYRITARGRCSVAAQPRPWECEPDGIGFRYATGRPLGLLLGALHTSAGRSAPQSSSLQQVFPVGQELQWSAAETGTLYFRINDFWNELADNQGGYAIEIERTAAPGVPSGRERK